MLIRSILVIFCLFFVICGSNAVESLELINLGGHHDNCTKYEHQFKQGLQLYYQCTIESTTQDFWFCKNCSGEFWVMFSAYELLKNNTDSRPGHENEICLNELINRDRMDFWFRIHTEAVKLWDDANCYRCHDWNGTFVNTSKPVSQNLTAEFETFLNLTKIHEKCVDVSKDVCARCEPVYVELNAFYETIRKRDKKNICFDIENSMNRTRRYWSGSLGCCHDESASFTVFAILASVIGALPVVFYGGAYFITKRGEDRSPVTDDAETTVVTPNMSSINNADAVPGTSAISEASTATMDDETNNLRENEAKSGVKATNVRDIEKKTNFTVNPVNLLPKEINRSQNLIDLERTPDVSTTSGNLLEFEES